MYITSQEFPKAFDQIRFTSLSHSACRIVIFVSCLDVDALCAAKILSNILKLELIPHKIIPIVGYKDLKTQFEGLDEDIANVICIGCGATIDLESFLNIIQDEGPDQEVQLESSRKIYIIDNHRPWNLDNLFEAKNVICFDDGGVRDLQDHKEAYTFLSNLDDDDDDDDDDDEEEAEEEEDHGNSAYDHTYNNNETNNNDTDEHDTDADSQDEQVFGSKTNGIHLTDSEDSPDPSRITSQEIPTAESSYHSRNGSQDNTRHVRLEAKKLKKKYVILLEDYYSQGTFVSTSSTIQLYTLLSLIGETSLENLWLTVIGVTAIDTQHSHIYSMLYPLIKDEVNRLGSGVPSTGENNSLSVETDYALFLLRHWSLYESMRHSSYLSAKLQLWTDDGRKKLHKMLAKMGISLQESKEIWTHMVIPIKRGLKEKFQSVSGMYGIEEIVRDGVIRKFGFKGTVTARDSVEALAALLESGKQDYGSTIDSNPATNNNNSGITAGNGLKGSEKQTFWVTNFWAGWDALEDFDELMIGISKAKRLQSAVAMAGMGLFEKRQIKNLYSFRLAVLKEGPELEIFKNPLALIRIGVWIAEGCAEANSQPLPLVVATLDVSTDVYLVLGMGPRKPRDSEEVTGQDDISYNKFGSAFQTTANKINAKVRMDAFESSIIEVAKEDLARFLEALAVSGLIR